MLYSQTYKQKPSVKLAPDAIVHINQQASIMICSLCGGTINISDYITSISTNLANNTTVGTATVTLTIPRHGHNGNYMVRGGHIFGVYLMDEIEIYIKSRFKDKTTGEHKYYKCFWGIVSAKEEALSDGVQTVGIQCVSMLRWLQIMSTNEHPSAQLLTNPQFKTDAEALFYTGKTYAGLNVFQIIYSLLSITYLNMVFPAAFDLEKVQTNAEKDVYIGTINSKEKELISHWKTLFSKFKSNLRMFGTDSSNFEGFPTKSKIADANKGDIGAVKEAIVPIQIFYDTKALIKFRPFMKPDQRSPIDVTSNSYKNNLAIIQEMKEVAGFEFYLDTTGEFIFKPPFWNLEVKSNHVYRVKDTDVLNWSFVESEEDIRTRVEVTGSQLIEVQSDSNLSPRGVYTDYDLAQQFGIRSEQISLRYVTTAEMCYYHAISELDKINANRFKGSITIVGRPELRLGIPLYIESRDCYVYIDNITHNFSFGGPFTTQIQFSALRRKYVTAKGDSGEKVLVFEKDTELLKSSVSEMSQESKDDKENKKVLDSVEKAQTVLGDKFKVISSNMLRTNRAGIYIEKNLKDALKELAIGEKAKLEGDPDGYLKFLDKIIPISDEEGYELIGSYENGRSVSMSENGTLISKTISFSKAISGTIPEYKITKVAEMKPSETDTAILADSGTADSDMNYQKGALKNSDSLKDSVANFLKVQAKSLSQLAPANYKRPNYNCPACQGPNFNGGVSVKDFKATQEKLISNKKN